jgi:long-chain fatty acid transport protein
MSNSQRVLRSTFIAAILLCAWRATARADVLYTYGFTPRGIGMGGALAAVADDFGAAYYNPAGSVFHIQPSVGAGYLYSGSKMTGIGIQAPKLDPTQGALLGTVLPIPLGGVLKERIAFAMSAFFPNGLLLGIDVPYPTQTQYPLLQNSGRSQTLIPTLAVKILQGLSIGGGVNIFNNTSGEWKARIDQSGDVQATVTQEMLTSFALTAGLMFKPGAFWPVVDGLRFGFVFRDKFFTHYKIPVATVVANVPLIIQFNAISLYTPRQFVGGVSYSFDRWLLSLEVQYNQWSGYPDPSLDVNVNFKIPVLPISFRNSITRPPHFHDTTGVKTGAEALALASGDGDLLARFGFAFDPSPVPPQSGDTNYLDSDRYIGSASVGWKWRGVGAYQFFAPLVFDVGGQLQYLPPRVSYKDSDVNTDNPGYPKVGFRGWLYAIGASISVPFDYE